MPIYADLLSIAADMQSNAVLLQGDSIAFLLTAMGEYLENHDNWQGSGEFGVLTDAETDNVDAQIAKAERALMGNLTGTIFMSAVFVEGALQLNGQEVLREEAPALYDKLVENGSDWIIDEDKFQLPDMSGLFPRGAKLNVGETGGEETHTLTITEMPAHTHVTTIPVDTLIFGGLEAPAAAATALLSETGGEGGNEPHNNLPPFYSFGFYIWT